MDGVLSVRPSVAGYLRGLHFLAFVGKAAVSTQVFVSVWHLPGSGVAGSLDTSRLNIFRRPQAGFHSSCAFCVLTTGCELLVSPPRQHLT